MRVNTASFGYVRSEYGRRAHKLGDGVHHAGRKIEPYDIDGRSTERKRFSLGDREHLVWLDLEQEIIQSHARDSARQILRWLISGWIILVPYSSKEHGHPITCDRCGGRGHHGAGRIEDGEDFRADIVPEHHMLPHDGDATGILKLQRS